MEKEKFSITINAPKEKVWSTLWDDSTYGKWTSVFSPTSYAKSDWKEGSKILFLDGEGSGMVSLIEKLVPNEFMSFKHLGEVKDGVEDTESDKVKTWAGAYENYFLKGENGVTQVVVEMDMNADFSEFLSNTFPKALQILKELAESK